MVNRTRGIAGDSEERTACAASYHARGERRSETTGRGARTAVAREGRPGGERLSSRLPGRPGRNGVCKGPATPPAPDRAASADFVGRAVAPAGTARIMRFPPEIRP